MRHETRVSLSLLRLGRCLHLLCQLGGEGFDALTQLGILGLQKL